MDVDDQEDLLSKGLRNLQLPANDTISDMAFFLNAIVYIWRRDGFLKGKSPDELESMLSMDSDLMQALRTACSTKKFEKVFQCNKPLMPDQYSDI